MADRKPFGTTKDGIAVEQITVSNKNGIELRCISYGCRITNLFVPAENGTADIVLGFDDIAGYEHDDNSGQGAFIGRYANRIRGGEFEINGTPYRVTQNEGNNFLHGSLAGKVFEAELIGENSVSFTYTSPDGEDGFPGELWIGVTYTLTDANELMVDYRARSDKDTYVNLTNHSYFNLAGQESESCLDHRLWLGCSRFLEVDEELLPTGRMPDVAGGAFDFTNEKPIGQDIEKTGDPQIKLGGGYDHCFVVDKQSPGQLAITAVARDPQSGRAMRVYTTQPAVQLYTGNFLDGKLLGKGGRPLTHRKGFCLETQHYPDSPHFPDFPSALLTAGDKFHETTVFHFEWEPTL